MDQEFLLDYAVAVVSLSLVFLAAAAILSRLLPRNFSRMSPHTKRNALMYALYLLNRDEAMLAADLGIPIGELVDYLLGQQEVPIAVVRKAIRLVLEKSKADKATQREVLRKIRAFDRKS